MGLDWVLDKRKPKDGHREEFHKLTGDLRKIDGQEDISREEYREKTKALNDRIDEISDSPYEAIGCPRIGIDPEATEWFRKEIYLDHLEQVRKEMEKPAALEGEERTWNHRNEEYIANWSRPFEELLEESKGRYVTELAKKREGVAKVSGMLTSAIDFRGKVIGYSEEIVGDDLSHEAYDDHTADECLDYAERLEFAINEWVSEHPTKAFLKTEEEDYPGWIENLRAGVQWLRFWGNLGFGYHAWY